MRKMDIESIIEEMRSEIARNMSRIIMPLEKTFSPSYISCCFTEVDEVSITGDAGCCRSNIKKGAYVETQVVVSRPGSELNGVEYGLQVCFSDPPEGSLKVILWRHIDYVFKRAVADYVARKQDELLDPNIESKNLKFHLSRGASHREGRQDLCFDVDEWKGIVDECTALLAGNSHVIESVMDVSMKTAASCFVNSKGSNIVQSMCHYEINIEVESISRSDNHKLSGDHLVSIRRIVASSPSDLPSREEVLEMSKGVISDLEDLLAAPVQKPLDRPMILDPGASAQLLYATLGSSVLNRCSYLPLVSLNAPKKGDKILPKFISVYDEPGKRYFQRKGGERVRLNSHMAFDEQGMRCRRLVLIRNGLVNRFPSTREYVVEVEKPNGHGRLGSEGSIPYITNMFISSGRTESLKKIRKRLINECRKKGHDYGFIIAGANRAEMNTDENYFKITPRMAYRLWAVDAKDPDTGKHFKRGDLQLVRGVELVGNPKMTLSSLVVTGDDYDVTVPRKVNDIPGFHQGIDAAIVCPSLYFSRAELKRDFGEKERPPLLPHPHHDNHEDESRKG